MNNAQLQAVGSVEHVPKRGASISDALYFAVRCAVMAPSSHNSQPWQFKILKDGMMLMLDRRRALPVVDPYDREMIISCGAALFNTRVALAYAGKRARIDVRPDSMDEDLLVRITLDGDELVSQDGALASLYPAARLRWLQPVQAMRAV